MLACTYLSQYEADETEQNAHTKQPDIAIIFEDKRLHTILFVGSIAFQFSQQQTKHQIDHLEGVDLVLTSLTDTLTKLPRWGEHCTLTHLDKRQLPFCI